MGGWVYDAMIRACDPCLTLGLSSKCLLPAACCLLPSTAAASRQLNEPFIVPHHHHHPAHTNQVNAKFYKDSIFSLKYQGMPVTLLKNKSNGHSNLEHPYMYIIKSLIHHYIATFTKKMTGETPEVQCLQSSLSQDGGTNLRHHSGEKYK